MRSLGVASPPAPFKRTEEKRCLHHGLLPAARGRWCNLLADGGVGAPKRVRAVSKALTAASRAEKEARSCAAAFAGRAEDLSARCLSQLAGCSLDSTGMGWQKQAGEPAGGAVRVAGRRPFAERCGAELKSQLLL